MSFLARLLRASLGRRRSRVALALLALVLGAGLTTALLAISGDILQRMSQELRSYGANILVVPRGESLPVDIAGITYYPHGGELLDEGQLGKLKTIFWRNNIVGFAPFLSLPVQAGGTSVVLTGTWFEREVDVPRGTAVVSGIGQQASLDRPEVVRAGVRAVAPWWRVEGAWAKDGAEEALVGSRVARRQGIGVGDNLTIAYQGKARTLRVTGVVSTGGGEEEQVFAPLPVAQGLLGIEKGAGRVLVSALVQPKSKLPADLRNKRPEEMTPGEYEVWYCTAIIEAITTQIEEALPGARARPIRQVSEAEESFTIKTQLLFFLVTGVALGASVLGVSATMGTLVLERRREIGLMKALGAEDGQVARVFYGEALAVGLLGGILGFLGGSLLARFLGERVFGSSPPLQPSLLPIALLISLAVAWLGSLLPVRQAVHEAPVGLLQEP